MIICYSSYRKLRQILIPGSEVWQIPKNVDMGLVLYEQRLEKFEESNRKGLDWTISDTRNAKGFAG